MCLLFSTANKSAQIYKLYAFIGQEWVSTVWGGNQHKQVHQFHRFSHLCIQENHITTHPLLIHSQQNKQSGSSCNRFAWLSLNFFRCASISWFQVVTQSVSDVFRLAHLRVFQSCFIMDMVAFMQGGTGQIVSVNISKYQYPCWKNIPWTLKPIFLAKSQESPEKF